MTYRSGIAPTSYQLGFSSNCKLTSLLRDKTRPLTVLEQLASPGPISAENTAKNKTATQQLPFRPIPTMIYTHLAMQCVGSLLIPSGQMKTLRNKLCKREEADFDWCVHEMKLHTKHLMCNWKREAHREMMCGVNRVRIGVTL